MTRSRCVCMSGHESRAAAVDRLTVLVRPMDPQPRQGRYGDGTPITRTPDNALGTPYSVWDSPRHGLIPMTTDCMHRLIEACPLGAPGDLLLGRETWAGHCCETLYQADWMHGSGADWWRGSELYTGGWRSPVTMPAKLARHRWTVVSVEVRRLSIIEGAAWMGTGHARCVRDLMRAWDARYARRGLGWETNPWVWLGRIERAGGAT